MFSRKNRGQNAWQDGQPHAHEEQVTIVETMRPKIYATNVKGIKYHLKRSER